MCGIPRCDILVAGSIVYAIYAATYYHFCWIVWTAMIVVVYTHVLCCGEDAEECEPAEHTLISAYGGGGLRSLIMRLRAVT